MWQLSKLAVWRMHCRWKVSLKELFIIFLSLVEENKQNVNLSFFVLHVAFNHISIATCPFETDVTNYASLPTKPT